MKINHVAWDWNGTLLDDAEACSLAVSRMLEKRNMGSLSISQYREKIEFPVRNLYNEAGFDLERESYEDICDEYIGNYIENKPLVRLQSDAREVLMKFQSRGIRQHIVSASGYDILIDQVERYGLMPFFENILGQKDNQAESKAHLAKNLLEITGCDPREVLFIGDTVHDFEVAGEAGFHCALVANGHCSRGRLLATGVPVYDRLSELYRNFGEKHHEKY